MMNLFSLAFVSNRSVAHQHIESHTYGKTLWQIGTVPNKASKLFVIHSIRTEYQSCLYTFTLSQYLKSFGSSSSMNYSNTTEYRND